MNNLFTGSAMYTLRLMSFFNLHNTTSSFNAKCPTITNFHSPSVRLHTIVRKLSSISWFHLFPHVSPRIGINTSDLTEGATPVARRIVFRLGRPWPTRAREKSRYTCRRIFHARRATNKIDHSTGKHIKTF